MTKNSETTPRPPKKAARAKPRLVSEASAPKVSAPKAQAERRGADVSKVEGKAEPAAVAASVRGDRAQAAEKWVNSLTTAKPPVRPRYPTRDAPPSARAAATEPSLQPEEPKGAPPKAAARSIPKLATRAEPAPAPKTAKAPPINIAGRAEPKKAKLVCAPEPQPIQENPPPATAAQEPPPAPLPPARPASIDAPSAPDAKPPLPPAAAAVAAFAAGAGFGSGAAYRAPDVEALANNVARVIEQSGKALAAYMRPRETGAIKATFADDMGEMVRSLGHIAEYYMSEPKRALEAQTALTTQFINLWAATLQRFQGAPAAPVAEPDRSDKRFSDAEWRDNPYFDFIKQAYVLTTRWADDLVRRADELDPHERDKAQFYLRQVTAALSPSNFVATNPELLRMTLQESGENLVRGLKMMTEDIETGKGNLRIRQSDARAFELGVNLAVTPGKVVFRNNLIELIQYEPTTPQVYKRPLLIVPPWINKFYILDLNPEKSFIRWAVAQGLTVFVISWVNPDERHADKGFDAYMREGILAALEAVEQATGERDVTAIGYCVGGTLLAATLGYMAAVGDKRIGSVTFFTALVDFTDAGDLKVFVDAEQLKDVEEKMAEHGYLEGSAMANAFNMLRPNDLIWSYYVNNYLKGKEPMPFDLLVWNSDSTRMPAANHNFYLRHCYLQNDLSNGRMVLGGKTIDLGQVTMPIYELASREDHIAPARGVFRGAKCFGGPVRFVLAGSGHIAGVVNPAGKAKYQYWTDGPPTGDFESWLARANETPGSWWPDWIQWVATQAPEKVPARKPGEGKLKALCDAPGDYVRVKA
ncbi:MAG: class I poly(R)-hydroxyalkanoic acid synthase [Roseiarcus sp.]|uniref:PHA/PHB synthase family protein n=1 Tax=Roseiarcus sp. TaxID=1969460 RepID=UPI003C4C7C24